VQVFDGSGFLMVTEANKTDGQSYYPFGSNARKDSTLYLGFQSAKPFPEAEMRMRVELDTEGLPPEGSHCELEDSKIHPPAELVWEYWNAGWKKLNIIKDATKAFLRSDYLFFKGPQDIQKSKQGLLKGPDDGELYWIRCLINKPGYEFPPKVDVILINTVCASNALTVKNEIVGSSDGTPDQSLTLRNIPVLLDTVLVEVDEGAGWEKWIRVDDMGASKRESKHFNLNRVTGELKFGNGLFGKIPFAGLSNIRATYRYGGGRKGNVGSGTITSLLTSPPDVEEVTNRKPAIGGEDEEALSGAKIRAPQELKTRHRAVTPDDFEFLAKETPGMRIQRAKAVPLYHPEFAHDLKIPGVITVIIVPYSEDRKPIPSEGTIRTVCEHLNKHRLLTTELFVIPPKYKKVKIDAEIVAEEMADVGTVKEEVERRLENYYHPLDGGRDQQGWPFGGDIYYSEAYRGVLEIKGVKRIKKLSISVDGEEMPHCKDVEIPPHFLVYSEEHVIKVDYQREENNEES